MEVIASWPSSTPLSGVADWAQRAEAFGFDVMHVPETIHDPFTVSALALASTETLMVRTSMVVAFPRSPMVTAYSAWDLARFSGGRFQLGLASQVRGNIVGRFSTEWSEPVARLRDYISAVRAIFASFQSGVELHYEGEHYTFDRLQPYFNPGPIETAPPDIWMGGVGPRMCELAGETADGFVCHPTNSHPEVLRSSILPAISAGRSRVDRSDHGPHIIAGPQPIAAATDAELETVREGRRAELAFLYSTPAYRPQLEMFGLGALGDALSQMAQRSDWADLHRHMTDDAIEQLVPQATYDALPDVLSEWYAGLCDGIVLTIPDDAHPESYHALVERCQAIAPRAAS
jgi:probable F420-dependent oxidoreductase